jgi:beta-galactosidase
LNHGFYRFLINEYGYLWLNRDGTPTTLTGAQYRNLLGPGSTLAQRGHLYYTYMTAETEFWRCYRKAAGVMIFTALGYSRPDGQTSDFFTNPATLEYNKECLEYLPDAFYPAALMLDEWGNEI